MIPDSVVVSRELRHSFFVISLTLPGPAFYSRLQKSWLTPTPRIMIDKQTTRAPYTISDYGKNSIHCMKNTR